VTILVFF